MTIYNLHEEVLLYIFDSYRQNVRGQRGLRDYERIWNNKNGWLKLAHVCHIWRSLVLASPSRLQLRLYFAHDSPTRTAVPQFHSHLPIIVDYSNLLWDANTLRRLNSELGYPDRVRGISIKGSNRNSVRISKALDSSFPALESFELYEIDSYQPATLLTTPFMSSIQSLRHLRLDSSSPILLSQILSVTTSLVDLTINVMFIDCLMNGPSIFPHLQLMPHLRNLQVSRPMISSLEHKMPHTMATLPELSHFRLSASSSEIEWLLAGLVAPSLLELHILLLGDDESCILYPNLSEFIRAAGIVFSAARLSILPPTFKTSLFARPLSIDGPASKIVTIETESIARPDIASSPILATVEDIFLSLPDPIEFDLSLPQDPLREFFNEFRNVKVLRLHHGLETIIADMLRQPTENPLPVGEELNPDATTPTSQYTLDILPSLEEIVVHARTPNMSTDGMESPTLLESFGPFVAARDQVGRPVKVSWDADGKIPNYFTMD